MVSIPAEYAYVAFALWTSLFAALIWWWKPELRKHMIFMASCGAIGGLVVGTWHRLDFWDPVSWGDTTFWGLHVSPWDALFGSAFTAITTTLLHLGGTYFLETEAVRPSFSRIRRERKVGSLVLIAIVAVICPVFITESVCAVSATFMVGACILYPSRRNLWFAALQGGPVTLAAYAAIIVPFLLFVENRRELAEQFCQYYVAHGALWTAWTLAIYITAYGVFATPLYAWIKNLRFVDGGWRRS